VSLQDKYRIQSALNDGESQSFRAVEISSGRSVLIHRLGTGRTPPGQPDLAFLIFKFLRSASTEQSRYLLEMGEDEGRIFVVTADAAGCLDLRQWLQSAMGVPGEKGDAQPELGGALEPGNFDFTRTFTTEALRKFSRIVTNSAAPPAPATDAPNVPTDKQASDDLAGPKTTPPPPPKLANTGSHEFTVFWDKYYPQDAVEPPKGDATPAAARKKRDDAPSVPAVGPEVLDGQPPAQADDASMAAIAKLMALSDEHERTHPPAAPAAKAGEFAGLAPVQPGVATSPVSAGEVDISAPTPPLPPKPASTDPSTRIPKLLADMLAEDGKAPPPTATPVSTPTPGDKQAAGGPPRRRPTMLGGFEVVFQSNRPRSRPTLSGVFAAPLGPAPPVDKDQAAPTPPEARLPKMDNPIVSVKAADDAGVPASGSPHVPGPQKPASVTGIPPPPLPAPAKVNNESEQATRLVSAPPVPASKPAPLSPSAMPVPKAKAPPIPPPLSQDALLGTRVFSVLPHSPEPPSPRISALSPTPSSRDQPGEYTRMTENIKDLAGPLPPLGEVETAPAGSRRDSNPAVPAPLSAQVSIPSVSAPQPPAYDGGRAKFQPSVYIVSDGPPHPAGRKRKVWVPILILSSLFVITLGVLFFFALKH
jgi:hypothetical protein